jgi:hypothetical protein
MAQQFADLDSKTPSPAPEEALHINSRPFRKHSPWTAARNKKKNRVAFTVDQDVLDHSTYQYDSPGKPRRLEL